MTDRIITNNVPRDIVDAGELTEAEQKEFDYLDWPAIMDGRDSASFFRYKGQLYDLSEFVRTDMPGWDGIRGDSFFSGLAVRYVNDNEQVVVALILS